jgi:hypothetical protein
MCPDLPCFHFHTTFSSSSCQMKAHRQWPVIINEKTPQLSKWVIERNCSFSISPYLHSLLSISAAWVIHLSHMDITFATQYMHYVISKHLSQMAFCGWVNKLRSQKSLVLPSMLTPYFLSSNFYLIIVLTGRQWQEHFIFRSLLQMIPGL